MACFGEVVQSRLRELPCLRSWGGGVWWELSWLVYTSKHFTAPMWKILKHTYQIPRQSVLKQVALISCYYIFIIQHNAIFNIEVGAVFRYVLAHLTFAFHIIPNNTHHLLEFCNSFTGSLLLHFHWFNDRKFNKHIQLKLNAKWCSYDTPHCLNELMIWTSILKVGPYSRCLESRKWLGIMYTIPQR